MQSIEVKKSDRYSRRFKIVYLTLNYLGGTFTDVFAITPAGKIVTLKILSENPGSYPDAPTYAIKKIIAQVRRRGIMIG